MHYEVNCFLISYLSIFDPIKELYLLYFTDRSLFLNTIPPITDKPKILQIVTAQYLIHLNFYKYKPY